MHLISYINPNEDPHEARAALRARFPDARIAMRAGWMWSANSNAESGFTHVRAPGFPGILAAYAAAGIAMCEAFDLPRVAPPDEIVDLPRHDEISILSAGPKLRQELAAVPARGLRIAINNAHVVGCDWLVANDGFSAPYLHTTADVVRVCRLRHAASLPAGQWYDLERLGVHEGLFSPVCAFRLAKAMGAKVIWLYGHDLIAGPGVAGNCPHSESLNRDIGTTVDASIRDAVASGITVHRVIVSGEVVTVDGKPVAPAAPAQPPAISPSSQPKRGRKARPDESRSAP